MVVQWEFKAEDCLDNLSKDCIERRRQWDQRTGPVLVDLVRLKTGHAKKN